MESTGSKNAAEQNCSEDSASNASSKLSAGAKAWTPTSTLNIKASTFVPTLIIGKMSLQIDFDETYSLPTLAPAALPVDPTPQPSKKSRKRRKKKKGASNSNAVESAEAPATSSEPVAVAISEDTTKPPKVPPNAGVPPLAPTAGVGAKVEGIKLQGQDTAGSTKVKTGNRSRSNSRGNGTEQAGKGAADKNKAKQGQANAAPKSGNRSRSNSRGNGTEQAGKGGNSAKASNKKKKGYN